MTSTEQTNQTGVRLRSVLDVIERIGNRLPDPLTIFVVLAFLVPILSWVVAQAGWTAVHPTTGETVSAVNLLSAEQIQRMFTAAVTNFTSFPPLGVVLVAMMGIGVAERSGLISVLLKWVVLSVPMQLITPTVIFLGIMSSVAGDVGYVVLCPLGALLYAGIGRHPIAGLAATFAGVSAGFSANLLLGMLDPLLGGFSTAAAQTLDPEYEVQVTANYYFMFASVFLITIVGWFISVRIVEPRLGEWKGDSDEHPNEIGAPISAREKKAAMAAVGTTALLVLLFLALTIPDNGILRNEEGELAPFFSSIATIMAIFFLVPGCVYGIFAGSIRSDRDVAKITGDTMATMGPYIVLAFAAAQFVAYFQWSNLGLMLAVWGADFLRSIQLGGGGLLVAFVVLAATINLCVGSASAKWAIMAPVFVPMFMALGLSPELCQAAYRVGDSTTNIVTPLNPYFPIVIAFAQKYKSSLGIGTLVSAMLPYAIAFLAVWTLALVGWYALGLPLGPGVPMTY